MTIKVFFRRARLGCLFAAGSIAFGTLPVLAADGSDASQDPWRINAQLTNVTQWHRRFRSPYEGANSLDASGRAEETSDVTLFAGLQLGPRTEIWVNPEIDQGFGLSNTLGVAGFPSGEAYKVGANRPYFRLPRVFLRHTLDVNGELRSVEAGTNQFASSVASNKAVFTFGKFSVVDIFDVNSYAHDPRGDFMNWAIVDAGAFDYAADPWGYTFGAVAEWTQGRWTLRGGAFQMSQLPNDKVAGLHPRQHTLVAEVEKRYEWKERPGKIKWLGFVNYARMASYREAVALGQATGSVPDVAQVRRFQARRGTAVNLEQEVAEGIGVFARASANDGRKEAYEFTEINRSLSGGLSVKGDGWKRADDTVGIAVAINQLSGPARDYFAAGGMGILIGDGRLSYRPERIVETYYAASLNAHLTLALNLQRISNPAYNADRGPVWVYGVRVHAEI